MGLKFHWRLLQGGEGERRQTRAAAARGSATGQPDLESQAEFCRRAEEAGFEGLLVDVGAAKPDPVLLSAALGMTTSKIQLIIACRPGLMAPANYVQQINTLSCLIGGDRIALNVVAGHSPREQRFYGDFLDHDQRYSRMEEFLAVANAFWSAKGPVDFKGRHYRVEQGRLNTPYQSESGRPGPFIFIGGGPGAARDVAIRQGSCWMRLAAHPEQVREQGLSVLKAGKRVGLRLSVICRPTREEALQAARGLLRSLRREERERREEGGFIRQSDSLSFKQMHLLADKEEWLTPCLWTGAVRAFGAPAIALVGDFDEVAQGLLEFGRAGASHFIVSGWPKLREMLFFGREVIPRVRAAEEPDAKKGRDAKEGRRALNVEH